ncbi:MAG: DUF4105 domain-containing protein [Tannerellaceae bacterium]|nr:DUF4105 domain-containing protein [Tannerellaceae bacterium]
MGDSARISILTSAPSGDAVFTLYGHAAFRVSDLGNGIDYVFNYGIFDFDRPHFLYRFARGYTDYILGVTHYPSYLAEYRARSSDVTEQFLNLNPLERQRIWHALSLNALPEHRTYRYNFFFDNCATRLPALLERHIDGQIIYPLPPTNPTFRQMINRCTARHPWLTFGCDLALGAPADRTASPHEQMFLPQYLQQAIAGAAIRTAAGETRPLVLTENVIPCPSPAAPTAFREPVFSPLYVCWMIFGIALLVSLWEWRYRRRGKIFDTLLFLSAALGGSIIFFLCFFSEHPAVRPNWSLLWLNPMYWISLCLLFVRRPWVRICFAAIAGFLLLVLLAWNSIPQYLNPAFLPLLLSLCLRSLTPVIRKNTDHPPSHSGTT